MSRLVHPRMMERLERDFFTQSCAIQVAALTANSVGEEVEGWATVSGWEAIACRLMAVGGGERRTSSQKYLDSTHVIELSGDYAVIETQRAVVEEQAYEILLVEKSAEQALTRLVARLVR